MKRTTIVIPDELASLLELERRRRDLSMTAIVREALSAYLIGQTATAKRLPFAALGHSGQHDVARRAEDIIAQEWDRARRR